MRKWLYAVAVVVLGGVTACEQSSPSDVPAPPQFTQTEVAEAAHHHNATLREAYDSVYAIAIAGGTIGLPDLRQAGWDAIDA